MTAATCLEGEKCCTGKRGEWPQLCNPVRAMQYAVCAWGCLRRIHEVSSHCSSRCRAGTSHGSAGTAVQVQRCAMPRQGCGRPAVQKTNKNPTSKREKSKPGKKGRPTALLFFDVNEGQGTKDERRGTRDERRGGGGRRGAYEQDGAHQRVRRFEWERH
jgi:hypothetical protein